MYRWYGPTTYIALHYDEEFNEGTWVMHLHRPAGKKISTYKVDQQRENVKLNEFLYDVLPLSTIHNLIKEKAPAEIEIIGSGWAPKGNSVFIQFAVNKEHQNNTRNILEEFSSMIKDTQDVLTIEEGDSPSYLKDQFYWNIIRKTSRWEDPSVSQAKTTQDPKPYPPGYQPKPPVEQGIGI